MENKKDETSDPAPSGWQKCFSKSQQRPYWYNEKLNRSVWKFEDISKSEEQLKVEQPLVTKRKIVEDYNDVMVLKQPRASASSINVAIIVPFRDLHKSQKRHEHLNKFVPYMEKFLINNERVNDFRIYIIEQTKDGRKFNRGKLLNVGFDIARREQINFDSYIFHDVDLLPQDSVAEYYAKIPKQPIHIAKCWSRYNNNPNYFGGIVAFSKSDFEFIDGFPNTFWGWGGEDDEVQLRVNEANLAIDAPPRNLENGIHDLEEMDLEKKLKTLRGSGWKCMVKWEVLDEHKKLRGAEKKPPWWGLKGITYRVVGRSSLASRSSIVRVDLSMNCEEGGKPHWTEQKAAIDEPHT